MRGVIAQSEDCIAVDNSRRLCQCAHVTMLRSNAEWGLRLAGRSGCLLLLVLTLLLPIGCEPPQPVEPPARTDPVLPAPPRIAPHTAARQGDLDNLRRHVELGTDINLRDEYGATLLHEAASAGQTNIVGWLLEQGVDLDARDESGFTPMQLASFMNHDAIVELLLRYGAEPVEDAEPIFEDIPEPEMDEPEVEAEPEDQLPEEWKDLEFLTWTSAAGQTVEAVFLEIQQDIVMLGSRDGRVSRVPINQLHRDDQIRARAMAGSALTATRTTSAGRAGVATGPTKVTAGFSGECEKLLVRAIQQAREEVLVAIYTLTRPEIERALSSAANRGVTVRVKYDAKQTPISRMQELLTRMEQRGVDLVPVTMSGRFASMHHKFAVIDRKEVFTGSFNFTVMAISQNYENCVLIESPDVARDFIREFERVRSR